MGKPSFPNDIVYQKVATLLGDVSNFTPIHGGEESQVFRFTSGPNLFIVRLNFGSESFQKDRFAFERFARPGLPIPEVFHIGRVDDCYFCLSSEMPGRTLEELPPEQVAQLLGPTDAIWQAIANSNVAGLSGFGPFDGRGHTQFSTWHGFLATVLETLWQSSEFIRSHIDLRILERWAEAYSRLMTFCPEERALVHGDFGSNNILAENGFITGVLDWSEAMIGDPLYDVANLFFWRTWLTCMEQQASYFESRLIDLPHCQERLLCYQLRIGLNEVLANIRQRRNDAVVWSLQRCQQIASVVGRSAL